ncbi:MAG: UDP-N-acetylmuramoyl-L-alanyl-D-glutamate--2,6-diaminopimelate ligase [Bacteroidetes bacterium]|nr:MAG: UDP-N-acetylmuramoyl-L-alanyl-D-glutamate--2,6-diaminopimelate ligase [Bacteroidota bacterium]
MILLQDILYKAGIRSVNGKLDVKVKNLQIDSRLVKKGSVFVAIKGVHVDGHQFIEQVATQEPVAIVCETLPSKLDDNITYVQVENSAIAAGHMAHNFYGQPSEKLKLVGVTGTNGKTTIATLLYKLFSTLGYKSGLLSTVQNQIGDLIIPATHTTPDVISLNSLLKQMVDANCTHAFMETSSHAIDQNRIAGLKYTGGIFSNITHDHLDYHKTFDEYIRVKKSFFDSLSSSAFALSNADDKRGTVMLQNTVARKFLYSLKTMADFKGKIFENNLTGLVMSVDDQEVHFRLIGEFNAYNLLAVYGAAMCLGEDKEEVLRCLSLLSGAEGRFDYVISEKDKVMAIVDYAHTPDALVNVLSTIQQLRKGGEQIITVVGCGGDRDKTKRPIMGEVACKYSERVVFTSDNPRSEDPAEILKEMETDLNTAARRKFISIVDRREAIKTAVSLANPSDILLIAGKGHEKYQEIKGTKYPFDDKEVVLEMFGLLSR